MQLVLITPPEICTAEPRQCNSLFAAGLEVLHGENCKALQLRMLYGTGAVVRLSWTNKVRKPVAGVQELRRYLQQLEPQYLHRVVLHQHHELADEYPLKGIHFKERERPEPPLPRFRPGLTQSTSLHTLEDVLQDWQNLDYAFLSPIFNSISKEGYAAAAFNLDELTATLSNAPMPVHALGGISPDRMAAVKQMGFAGVGILGAVWARDDPLAAFEEFLHQL